MKTLPAPEPRRTKRDAVATKAAIVAAALEEFAELGLAGARIDEIARAARVNKALLYYYFESKEHLYQGAVEQMFVVMTDALRRALDSADEPGKKLLSFLDANFRVLAERPAYARLLEQEMDIIKVFLNNLQPDTAPKFLQQIAPLLAEFREVLEEGVNSGVFRPIDIDAVLPLLLMLVRTAVRGIPMAGKFISAARKVSAQRRRAAAIDFITCALFSATAQSGKSSKPRPSQ
ncbi:MAG: TetR/AcrR family transcriptional regulator [Verrucomicrobia bacterium]|nr:TetR/AcrR family transcriptional regulator [Verrucomicrobiota bacterium]MBV8377316.1 TetR/AcrR family transcriptional regulator [Verrucomicrobiota bacterium]